MQSATERRFTIIQVMCQRRYDKIGNLAFEFGVSRKTIMRDVQILTCSFPIYTTQGTGGGVHIVEGYKLGMKYMTVNQVELLERISVTLTGEDLKTAQAILKTFRQPKK